MPTLNNNWTEYEQRVTVPRHRKALRWLGDHFIPAGKRMKKLRQEMAKMAACLQKGPDGYIAWTKENDFLVSKQARDFLKFESCKETADIVAATAPGDQSAVDHFLKKLAKSGESFDVVVQNSSGEKTLHFFGGQGLLGAEEPFYVLWIKDITHMAKDLDQAQLLKARVEDKVNMLQAGCAQMPFPIWFRDKNTKIVWCNKAYANALELTIEEVLESQTELLGSKGGLGKAVAERAKTAKGTAQDKRHIIVEGERRLMEVTESYLTDSATYIGYAQDVTPLEEIETELKRFKASSSELLRALNTGIAIFNPDHRLTFFNDAFVYLWQLEETWLHEKPTLSEILDVLREKRRLPEQADFRKFKDSWNEFFTSLIAPHEDMMHLPDGTAIRILVVPHPMGGLFITYEDVTSRLELESSYNTLIAVQRETIDNLAEGLAVYGPDGRLTLCNTVYAKMWGLRKRDLTGEPHVTKIVDKCKKFFDEDEWNKNLRQELQDSALVRNDRKGRLFLNDDRVLEYVTVALPDGGMLLRFSDVTDSLRVENALLEKNAALEEAERLKLDFLANVSYQLRTPLNAMMGFAEVLDKQYFGELNERQKEYSGGMLDAGKKLIALINDILDLSTIEAGYLELNINKLDVYEMMESLEGLTREWAGSQNIQLVMECPKNIGTIESDERRLKQIMLNLINNAIKFTPEKGTIRIVAERMGKTKLALTVEDNGEGISKEDQQRVFGAFVQTKQRNSGAGLGLSLVKSMVELLGGDVQLESDVGKGTKITCILPVKN